MIASSLKIMQQLLLLLLETLPPQTTCKDCLKKYKGMETKLIRETCLHLFEKQKLVKEYIGN
jgi:hypothetical protein